MAKKEEILKMDLDQLCDYNFIMEHFDDPESIICTLREQKINGKVFVNLTDDHIKTVFPLIGEQIKISLLL